MMIKDDSKEIVINQSTGRSSGQVYIALRRQVLEGAVAVGDYLPTERQLSQSFAVAHTTVRRALARLQADGLIRPEPRKGYRVLGMANDPLRGCPVAYIRSDSREPAAWDEHHARLMSTLQDAADRKGWPLAAMGESAIQSVNVRTRLAASHAWAAILDSNDPAALSSVKDAGLPLVMVDSWVEGSGVDSVLQDGHHGGMLASRYLAEAGCRRIAWFGRADCNVHVFDRFGGFCAGLLSKSMPTESSLVFQTSDDVLSAARKILSGAGRPDGIAALWNTHISPLAQAAAECGLVIGKDLQLVGWTPSEMYASRYAPMFHGIAPPPAITWDLRAMADAAMAILLERRANPGLPELRVRVPVRLRIKE